jgi:hypothetical protein
MMTTYPTVGTIVADLKNKPFALPGWTCAHAVIWLLQSPGRPQQFVLCTYTLAYQNKMVCRTARVAQNLIIQSLCCSRSADQRPFQPDFCERLCRARNENGIFSQQLTCTTAGRQQHLLHVRWCHAYRRGLVIVSLAAPLFCLGQKHVQPDCLRLTHLAAERPLLFLTPVDTVM